MFRISYNGILSIPTNGNSKTLGKLCRLVEISRTIECDIQQRINDLLLYVTPMGVSPLHTLMLSLFGCVGVGVYTLWACASCSWCCHSAIIQKDEFSYVSCSGNADVY